MLNWCPKEENFVLFTEEELEKIILDCINCGIIDFNKIYEVIGQFETMRLGSLMLDRYLNKEILFTGLKGEDLAFRANDNND